MKMNRFLCASILFFFIVFANIAHTADVQQATGEGPSKEQALYEAMRQAVEHDPRKGGAVPSTKGLLGEGSLN